MTWCPRCQRGVACDRTERPVDDEMVTVVVRCSACGTTLSMTDERRSLRARPKVLREPAGTIASEN